MPKFSLILIALLVILLAACGDAKSKIAYTELPPEGDPVRGGEMFSRVVKGQPSCTSCHVDNADDGGSPNLTGIGEAAATRVQGLDAREYLFWSITEPQRHIVQGYGNAMPNKYDDELSPQDIADLIAYLMTL